MGGGGGYFLTRLQSNESLASFFGARMARLAGICDTSAHVIAATSWLRTDAKSAVRLGIPGNAAGVSNAIYGSMIRQTELIPCRGKRGLDFDGMGLNGFGGPCLSFLHIHAIGPVWRLERFRSSR